MIVDAPREPGQGFRAVTRVSRRDSGGICISQGERRVFLSRSELAEVVRLADALLDGRITR